MRKPLLAIACALTLALTAYLFGQPKDEIEIRLRLVDAETGKDIAGIVRVFRTNDDKPLPWREDKPVAQRRLVARARSWAALPAGGAEVMLPRARLQLEAVSGLETLRAQQEIDLSTGNPREIKIPLRFLFRPEKLGLFAGNTHVHLNNNKDHVDQFLRTVPPADGLRVVFVSQFQQRIGDKNNIITNAYPVGDVKGFETAVNNGEEYRHNFKTGGRYGHVMLLGLKQLVEPMSIGPALSTAEYDDPSLSVGIDNARRQGATVIWAHNGGGYECLPNALLGRVDALNCGDGTDVGPDMSYYRMLNVGLRMPLSSGTDFGIYDFHRVYAKVDGPLSIKSWLDAVKAGRTVITNGPLLTLTVDGSEVGATINLDKPRKVRVEATALGRHDFQELQLVHNGKMLASEPALMKDGRCSARLLREVSIDQPGWFAARIDTKTKNEFDGHLFAHTSPVYVDVAGQRILDVEAARSLLHSLERSPLDIRKQAQFSSPQAGDKVIAVYEQAAQELTKRINERAK